MFRVERATGPLRRATRPPLWMRQPAFMWYQHVRAEARRQVAAENGRVARSTRTHPLRAGSCPHPLLITPVSAQAQKRRRCRSSVQPSLPEWAGGFDQGRRGSRPYHARGDAISGRDAFHRVRRVGLSIAVLDKHLACLTVSDRRDALRPGALLVSFASQLSSPPSWARAWMPS